LRKIRCGIGNSVRRHCRHFQVSRTGGRRGRGDNDGRTVQREGSVIFRPVRGLQGKLGLKISLGKEGRFILFWRGGKL